MDSESKMGCRNVTDRFQHPKLLLWKANDFVLRLRGLENIQEPNRLLNLPDLEHIL